MKPLAKPPVTENKSQILNFTRICSRIDLRKAIFAQQNYTQKLKTSELLLRGFGFLFYLTRLEKHATIKIQRGTTVVDGLPLEIFSYKKATVVSQAGGCFFALSEPIIYPSVKKEARTPKTPRNSNTVMDNTPFRNKCVGGLQPSEEGKPPTVTEST